MIVSDNGTELTSNAVLVWCGDIGVEWHYIAPGPARLGTGSTGCEGSNLKKMKASHRVA